jgi:hypothetical protein
MNTKTGRLIRYLPLSINVYGVGGLIGSIIRKTSFLLIRSFLQHEKYAVSSAFATVVEAVRIGVWQQCDGSECSVVFRNEQFLRFPNQDDDEARATKVGLVCQILATLVAAVVPI